MYRDSIGILVLGKSFFNLEAFKILADLILGIAGLVQDSSWTLEDSHGLLQKVFLHFFKKSDAFEEIPSTVISRLSEIL